MYLPARYANATEAEIDELVRQYPLATLITPRGTEVKITHCPLVLVRRGDARVLVGHLARANPHWKFLEGNETTAIFHGPQAYITPLWYEQCDVPTWNYVVAHLSGTPRLLEEEEATVEALRMLSARMEGENGWTFEVPEDLARPGVLMKSIIGFELPVSTVQAKFKLSQNKSATDFQGVIRGLGTRKDEQSRGVLEWMQHFAKRVFDKE